MYAFAAVVESADTRDLKSLALKSVPVQVRSAAPDKHNPNQPRQIIPVGDGFGFVLYLEEEFFTNGRKVKDNSKPRAVRNKRIISEHRKEK